MDISASWNTLFFQPLISVVFHIQFLNCISKLESTQLHGKKRHYCFGFAWIPVGFTHFPERQHSDHTARKITLLFLVPAHTDLQEKAHAEAISVTENMRFKLSDLKSPSLILLHLKQTNKPQNTQSFVLYLSCNRFERFWCKKPAAQVY